MTPPTLTLGMPSSLQSKLPVSNANLLRIDPTRTGSIVRRFISDIRRRVRKLAAAVTLFLDTEDELGLKHTTTLVRMARRTFAFHTDSDKLKAFNSWFAQQVEANVLIPRRGPNWDPTKPWTAEYVEAAYKRGLLNSYFASKKGFAGDIEQNQLEFMRGFNSAEAVSKLRLLATRSFEELKGVTAQMSASMSRTLAAGLAEGRNPIDIAKTMRQSLGTISKQRAELIAKSEVIRAHAEGQLDSFEKLGVKELGLRAEFSTALDSRVCPQCAALEGQVYPIEEARGLIPLHPRCRCSWIPVTD